MSSIHPTAIVDAGACIGEDVEIGPYCIVEHDVTIGDGTVLRPHVVIQAHTTLGKRNYVDSFCALGGYPQDLKFDPTSVSYVRIGDDNVFREGVSISRATRPGGVTMVGNKTYWMLGSHSGHDSIVRDRVILVNNAAIAGHAEVRSGTILSASAVVHQYCWVGEMVMTQGLTGTSTHVPPYTLMGEGINHIIGLNKVGLRRAEHISSEDYHQIRSAYRMVYGSDLRLPAALERMDACTDWGEPAGVFREFIRRVVGAEGPYQRPLCPLRTRSKRSASTSGKD